MNDTGPKNPETGVHRLQIQKDKKDDKDSESPMRYPDMFLPLSKSIDHWIEHDKYTITSTGNGNVDTSGK